MIASRARWLGSICSAVLVCTAGPAHAGEPHATFHLAAGVKGGYLAGFAHGEVAHSGGGGAFVEWTAVQGWLELELGARYLGGHGHLLPIDLLAKKPFHLTDTVHPYLGLGPTFVLAFADGTSVHYGLATVAGSYLWLAKHIGLLAELNYNLVYEDGAVHEVGAAAGLAFRW